MFSSLFRRDPTRKFKRTVQPPLTWDTRNGTVNNVAIGGPIETLAPLGPASDHSSNNKDHHYLEYADLGIIVVALDGNATSMMFPIKPTEDITKDPNFKPAEIRIRPAGLTITSRTSEADVMRVFGRPRERDVDDEMISLQYDIGELIYEFDFSAEGKLETFTVYKDD